MVGSWISSTEANPKVIVPESYAGSQVIFTLTGFNQDGFSSQDIITIDLKPKIQVETQEKLPCFGEERNHQVTISKNQYFDDKTIALFDESKASIVDENANFITFTFNKANSPLTLTLHDTTARYCDLTLSFDFRTNEEIKASLETTSIDSTCVSVVTPEDESPLTYQWSNGGTSKIASPIPAGLSQSQLPIQRPDAKPYLKMNVFRVPMQIKVLYLAEQYIPILLTIIYI
jgi:hypothetical protein